MRNEFIFNFGVVLEADVDRVPYERVVRRLAVTFAEMEVQDGYLSGQEVEGENGWAVIETEKRRSVEGLLEIVREDLNNYGECMIPVGEYQDWLFLFVSSFPLLFLHLVFFLKTVAMGKSLFSLDWSVLMTI